MNVSSINVYGIRLLTVFVKLNLVKCYAILIAIDVNNDNRIDEHDIRIIVRLLTGNAEDLEHKMQEIAKRVILCKFT